MNRKTFKAFQTCRALKLFIAICKSWEVNELSDSWYFAFLCCMECDSSLNFHTFQISKKFRNLERNFVTSELFASDFFQTCFNFKQVWLFFEHCEVAKRQILITAELSAHKMGLKLSAVKWQRSETSEKKFFRLFLFESFPSNDLKLKLELREYLHSNSHTIAMKSLISISLELV